MARRKRKTQPERIVMPIIRPGEKIPAPEKAPIRTPEKVPANG